MGLVCKTCNLDKPETSFTDNANAPGKRVHCKDCRATKARKHRVDFPDLYRGYEYKKKYKITIEIFNEVLEKQNGVCAICGGVNSDRPLAVDHDHSCCPGESTCGKCLRGLLCGRCNTGLGSFRDNIEILKSAVQYIENVKGSPWQ